MQVRGRLREVAKSGRELGRALVANREPTVIDQRQEPPVVSRLVVEIRSDGSRTIARGAMEDVNRGEKVAIRAEGATPAELVGSLAKALLKAPWLAFQAARALDAQGVTKPSSADDEVAKPDTNEGE